MDSTAMHSLGQRVLPAGANSPASEPGVAASAVLSRMMGTLSLSSWQPPARASSRMCYYFSMRSRSRSIRNLHSALKPQLHTRTHAQPHTQAANRSSSGTASYSSPSYLAARRRVLKSYGIKESTTAPPPPPSKTDQAPYVATPLPGPPPPAGVRVFYPDTSDCDHTGGDGGNDFLASAVPMGPSADVRSLDERPQERDLCFIMEESPPRDGGRGSHGYEGGRHDANELVPGEYPPSSPGSTTPSRMPHSKACSPRTRLVRGLNGGVLKGAGSSRVGAGPAVKRLLVVDDSRTTRTLLRKTFARKGYVCDMACNGKVALAMMQNRWYDAVFMVRLKYNRTNAQTLRLESHETRNHLNRMSRCLSLTDTGACSTCGAGSDVLAVRLTK